MLAFVWWGRKDERLRLPERELKPSDIMAETLLLVVLQTDPVETMGLDAVPDISHWDVESLNRGIVTLGADSKDAVVVEGWASQSSLRGESVGNLN